MQTMPVRFRSFRSSLEEKMIGIFVVAVVTALPVMAHAGHLDMEFTAASEGSRITPQVAANHPCDTGNIHPCDSGVAHPCDTGDAHPCPVSLAAGHLGEAHPCDTGNTHPCPAGLALGQIQAAHPCDTGSAHPCPVAGSLRNPEAAHPCDDAGVHPCEATLALGKPGFSSLEVSWEHPSSQLGSSWGRPHRQ